MNGVSVLAKMACAMSWISIKYGITYEIGWYPSRDIGLDKSH